MHVQLLNWRSPCLVMDCCVHINVITPCRTSSGCHVHIVSQKQLVRSWNIKELQDTGDAVRAAMAAGLYLELLASLVA